MTKKKRMALAEQARLEEQRKAEAANANQQGMMCYPGLTVGANQTISGKGVIPVMQQGVKAVQLPPIIQPISFMPTPMQMSGFNMMGGMPMMPDAYDDFEDFDDWD